MIDWDDYEHFSEVDFPPEEGEPSTRLLLMLQAARSVAGVPFIINSGVRPGDDGAHGRGLAADIRATDSRTRYLILVGLLDAGFNRIGIYPRHIHADCDPSLDPEVCWFVGTYPEDDDD